MTSYPTPVLNASRPTGDISKIYTTLTEIIYEANINGKLLNYGKLFLPEPKGPVSPEELISNGVMKNSLVWKNGMAQWLPAGEIHEIAKLFTNETSATSTPPPFPPTPPHSPVNNNTKPDNWLVWAILSTILCCLPLGIVSIIYATKVDNLWNPGQQEEAIKASNTARLFFFLALGGGVLALIIGFISDLTRMMLGGGYY